MNRNVKKLGSSPCKDLRKNLQERENGKYKGPEVEVSLVSSI